MTKSKLPIAAGQQIALIDLATLSPQHLRLIQFHLSRLVASLLSQEHLVANVIRRANTNAGKMDASLEKIFRCLVECSIAYLTTVARLEAPQSGATSVGKFWKSLMQKSYDILDKVSCSFLFQ